MRKRFRTITVNETRYAWRVTPIDEAHVQLKVWLADVRGTALQVRFRFDDPWHLYPVLISAPPEARERAEEIFQLKPITPSVVRAAIEGALAIGWNPDGQAGTTFDVVAGADGLVAEF